MHKSLSRWINIVVSWRRPQNVIIGGGAVSGGASAAKSSVHVGVGIFALSPQFTSQDECDTYTMSTVLAVKSLKKQTTIFFGRSSPWAEIKGEECFETHLGWMTGMAFKVLQVWIIEIYLWIQYSRIRANKW